MLIVIIREEGARGRATCGVLGGLGHEVVAGLLFLEVGWGGASLAGAFAFVALGYLLEVLNIGLEICAAIDPRISDG
jgi:hypothetical protein